MAVSHGFLFPHDKAEQSNAPSSGDGASHESAYSPMTGERIPGYQAPLDPARMDTSGANSGLGNSASGAADARAYVDCRDALSGAIIDGGAGGINLPAGDNYGDHSDRFTTKTEGI